MLISCPECHFKRHVDEKQIPKSATLATCPKCQHKFRFRDPETGDFIPEICLEREESPETKEQGTDTAENIQEEKQHAEEKQEDPVPLSEEELSQNKNEENPLQEPQLQSYEQAEKKRSEQYVMITDDVPWEHPERYGIFGSLLYTLSRVMFRGKDFFSTIHSQVSSLRPASFYALIGLFQAVVAYFFSPNVVDFIKTADLDPQKQALIENLISNQSLPMVLISTPFIMILQLLIYTAFIYLAIRITNPEKADFPLTLRVIAYASAPMILSIVPYAGGIIGLVWFIYNIFIGIKYAMRLSWQRTFLALAPIFLLWLFIAFNQAISILNAIQA